VSDLGLPDQLAADLRSTDHRIIVTGASGWIGSATMHMLNAALGPDAFKRRVMAFAGTSRSLRLLEGTEVPLSPLEALSEIGSGSYLLFHYAFLGREKVATLRLDEYCAANGRITDIVRGTVERIRPAGMFLTSSGAVYRADRSIDDDLAVNAYGVLKHRDEVAFAEACAAAGTKLVTARVFNLSGEYINKLTSYALSSFILDALAGRPITVRATRRVERSYVYVGDVIALGLACQLDSARAPRVFDTVGEREVEVGELAQMVHEICGQPDLPILRAPIDETARVDRYVGHSEGMRSLLARHSVTPVNLLGQIGRTASYLPAQAAGGKASLRQTV
jgi:UDP-glucuronate decarboxylase